METKGELPTPQYQFDPESGVGEEPLCRVSAPDSVVGVKLVPFISRLEHPFGID